jgi:hypothetical protein
MAVGHTAQVDDEITATSRDRQAAESGAEVRPGKVLDLNSVQFVSPVQFESSTMPTIEMRGENPDG